MKIDKLFKILMVVFLTIALISFANPVKATDIDLEKEFLADDEEYDGNVPFEDGTGNTNTDTNTNSNTDAGTNTSTDTNSNSNTSIYDNTNNDSNLPKAGIEDWNMLPVIVAICVVSGIFAIKKLNEYKDI